MGQRPSFLLPRSRPKISLTWVLRGGGAGHHALHHPGLEHRSPMVMPVAARTPVMTHVHQSTGKSSRSPSRERTSRRRHSRGRSPRRKHSSRRRDDRVGYEITDIDAFLSKASLEKPGNIPVVLAAPSMLYLTRLGGYQEEVSLPLGTVVNAVFKNTVWLYVQTPHGTEGYVSYAACLPLGILPPPQHPRSHPPPCWESHTDIFPLPLGQGGNRTDYDKIRTRSECGYARKRASYERDAVSACGERSVDRLYLRAAASAKERGVKRHTLLVIRSDYDSKGRNTLSVTKGDVVALVSNRIKDWFWVRTRDGKEGFIPSVVGGHGFL